MRKRNIAVEYVSPKKYKFQSSGGSQESLCDFRLPAGLVDGTVVTDLLKKKWRIGKPVGKGSFGEIYLTSEDIFRPVDSKAEYVIKIEPHISGPLFAEINCLVRAGRITDNSRPVSGIPIYIASGSHYFADRKYRFMIIPRYRIDLNALIKYRKLDLKNILVLAVQILDILEYLHMKGFTHSDIKAHNLMLGVEKRSKLSPLHNNNTDSHVQGAAALPHVLEDLSRVHLRMCNPLRSCRVKDMAGDSNIRFNLRPTRYIKNYTETASHFSNCSDDIESNFSDYLSEDDDDYDEEIHFHSNIRVPTKEFHNDVERVFLIDFGLASKFIDTKGVHRPFCIDERRAHDGTLEYSSRDAHFGAHSRRSDLECLGFNLLDWVMGDLPWKDDALLLQPEIVHKVKECFMSNVKQMMHNCYNGVNPKFMVSYLEYVNELEFNEDPDYEYCKQIFRKEFVRLGYKLDDMVLNFNEDVNTKITKNVEGNAWCGNVKVKKPSLSLVEQGICLASPCGDNVTNRISPKNLRSKHSDLSDSIVSPKRLRSKSNQSCKSFSWTDFLCNKAESILQEKLEHCFEPDEAIDTNTSGASGDFVYRYEGRPTYAIQIITNRIKEAKIYRKGKGDERKSIDTETDNSGMTYAMRLILDKMHTRENKENINKIKRPVGRPRKITRTTVRVVKAKQVTNSVKKRKTLAHKQDGVQHVQAVLETPRSTRSLKKQIKNKPILKDVEDISTVKLKVTNKTSKKILLFEDETITEKGKTRSRKSLGKISVANKLKRSTRLRG